VIRARGEAHEYRRQRHKTTLRFGRYRNRIRAFCAREALLEQGVSADAEGPEITVLENVGNAFLIYLCDADDAGMMSSPLPSSPMLRAGAAVTSSAMVNKNSIQRPVEIVMSVPEGG